MASEVIYFFPADKNIKDLLIDEINDLDGYIVSRSGYDFSNFSYLGGLSEGMLLAIATRVVNMYANPEGARQSSYSPTFRREPAVKVIFECLKKIATVGDR
jgi:hypothetical protein